MTENFSGKRILIVEDEFIIAHDLQNILTSLGYQVVGTADNFEDALALLDSEPIDLALIDILLKGDKGGIEVAHEMNAHWNIPFVFVTSHTDERTLNSAKSTNPYGYIVKPFEQREILATIDIALYKKENEDIRHSQFLQQLQLQLTNTLDNQATVASQLQEVVRVLEPVIPSDQAALYWRAKSDQKLIFLNRLGFREFQAIDETAIMQVVPLQGKEVVELFPRPEKECSIDPEAGSEARKRLFQRYHIESVLQIPITSSGDMSYCLELYSQEAGAYSSSHYQITQQLTSTLRLLFENIFAFEAIRKLTNELQNEKQYLLEELASSFQLDGMTSHSQSMQEVIKRIETVAKTSASVLIQGETGTGKELSARAIHRNSPRNNKPFIKINCAAIPSQLIESELFGHEKGAFTGAHEKRIGKFELADQGTLFLDEIGEMPLELQPKLLRALQEGEFERLGSNKTLHSDIRLICATNRMLPDEVAAGRFRADLYYRISVFPVLLPPLRERREDTSSLAVSFAQEICAEHGSTFLGFDQQTQENFQQYDWPGNIRELRNVVEQLCILYRDQWMHWDLPAGVTSRLASTSGETHPHGLKANILQTERENILQALRTSGGRIRGDRGAAAILGIKPTTLEYRIKKLNITREEIFS